MVLFEINELPPELRSDAESFLCRHPGTPAAILRPRIAVGSGFYVTFLKDHSRDTAVGVGRTPAGALEDFNHFFEPGGFGAADVPVADPAGNATEFTFFDHFLITWGLDRGRKTIRDDPDRN